MVQCDPDNWVMKELRFTRNRDEVKYQAENAKTAIQRILAVDDLAWRHDTLDAVEVFARLAIRDPFYVVRREAVKALGGISGASDSIKMVKRSVFSVASRDVNPSVRTEATTWLGKLHGDSAAAAAIQERLSDSSDAVVSAALTSLPGADSIHAAAQLAKFLEFRSRRSVVANAALRALARVDSNKAIASAWNMIGYGRHAWSRFAALTVLEKFQSTHLELGQRLMTVLGEKPSGFRGAAIHAIGEYAGADAIPRLEPLAKNKSQEGSSEAEDAIKRIKERTWQQ
jgi:HEAT repeat protein